MSWLTKAAERFGYLYCSEFSGRCLDGPMRGQHVVKTEPFFRAINYSRVQPQSIFDPLSGIVSLGYVVYRWSWCLQCWTVEY